MGMIDPYYTRILQQLSFICASRGPEKAMLPPQKGWKIPFQGPRSQRGKTHQEDWDLPVVAGYILVVLLVVDDSQLMLNQPFLVFALAQD